MSLSQTVTVFPGALTCSMANCQYGCDAVKGQIRCKCPSPGLQLAPDGRTCVGECKTKHLCQQPLEGKEENEM